MKGDVCRSVEMPIHFLAGPSLNKRRIVKIAILECYLMLQRIYTFIKQWETLSLLFLFFRGFLLHEILRKPWGKIHMRGGHEALTEAKK